MTAITSVIIPDAEAFLRENLMEFATDNVAAVYPLQYGDEYFESRDYWDREEGKRKSVSATMHVLMLAKLAKLIDDKKLFVGGLKAGVELADPCNWDAEVVDAYFQLCYHGELVYG